MAHTINYRAGEFSASDYLVHGTLGQPSAEVLGDPQVTRALIAFEDERVTMGSWECEPGLSRWEFTTRGEFIHVLSGSMTVTEDGGEPTKLTAGSTAIFPLGWKGSWEIHETLRKVFTVYRVN